MGRRDEETESWRVGELERSGDGEQFESVWGLVPSAHHLIISLHVHGLNYEACFGSPACRPRTNTHHGSRFFACMDRTSAVFCRPMSIISGSRELVA